MNKKFMVSWMASGHTSIPKLLLIHYSDLGINEEELVVLLHVHTFLEEGYLFPTPDDLARRMTHSPDKCAQILNQLLKRDLLALKELQEEGVMSESYTLEPLWEQLLFHLHGQEEQAEKAVKQEEELNVFTMFERELSRPLSPMECETLTMWLDQDNHSPALIKAALKEAVVAGKLSLRYIDRILFEWSKNGIKTVQQARAYGEKFRKYQQKGRKPQATTEKENSFPTYNWLEQ
ncbi:DnaD domain-containing protein [Bacillus sp. FJAT-45350]|uniref:DnaD domain-containing protein n=1 Tax=Bacillus sp. FJAT-45350 TaxID=2011014 RepID=UPI000BB93C81|nr:DnaD domain-containing protein [Bacillus sp. FJAT-45350]